MTAVYIRRLEIGEKSTPAELSAYRSAEVRRLLADCLVARYGEGANGWTLAKTPEGKPYLTAAAGELPQISLSHSGKWVACALSDSPVGVDVQEVRPIGEGVFRRFMPNVDVARADDRAKTRLWTRYEACLKRYGSRESMVPDAEGQCYDSIDLDDAVVTVYRGDDEVEWIIGGAFENAPPNPPENFEKRGEDSPRKHNIMSNI